MTRKLLFLLLLASSAHAQYVGEVSLSQLGTQNDVDAVCTANNLDIRDLTSASDSVAAVCSGTVAVSNSFLLDATYTGRTPAGASPADNESNTNTALSRIGNYAFIFDGSAWDRDTGSRTCNAGTNLNTSALLTTSAHDAAFGTAGSADSQVRSVQGIASGTPVAVSHGGVEPFVDPCEREAKTVFVVDIVTAGTTEIANQVTSEFFYVCSINLVTAAANNVAIVEDDTDACASPTAGLNGGVTAAEGWNFAANGGIVVGNGQSTVMKTGTANHFWCIITGAATQLSGTIMYVSAP